MRYLCIYKPSAKEGTPPSQKMMSEMGKLIADMKQAGILLATEGCLPSAKGARVRLSHGKFTVTDGPFTETKELIAGFALVRVKSKQEAVEWTKRFLDVAGDGESEIREIYEETNAA